MLYRILLAYLLAMPAIVPLVARSVGSRTCDIVVQMTSSVPGVLQVFYDEGDGFKPSQVLTKTLRVVNQSHEYRFSLPSGRYVGFRIDPAMSGGSFVLHDARIVNPDGATVLQIPLAALVPAQQLTLQSLSTDRLELAAPAGSNDPILIYAPPQPVVLPPDNPNVLGVAAQIALYWGLGLALAYAGERLLQRVTPYVRTTWTAVDTFGRTNAAAAIGVTALVATIVATYPVIFLDRSLVTPNNGGVAMLYDAAPYVPGSTDFDIEDTRGSDVGATMWQSIPHARIQREALAQGEFPLWNRYNAAGRPLWGQGLSYLLDPLHWLALLGDDPAPGWDLTYLGHRFVFACGAGLAALAVTSAWLPAAIVASIAPFAGVHAFRVSHPALFSLTYAPWVILSWFLLCKATTRRSLAAATALLAVTSSLVLFASTPKEAATTLLAVDLAGVLAVLVSPGRLGERWRRLQAMVVAGVITLLITAPDWLVFLDTLRGSQTAYDSPGAGFAGAPHLLGLFLSPLIPGTPLVGLNLAGLVLVIAAALSPVHLLRARAALACGATALLFIAAAFGVLPHSWILGVPLLRNIGHIGDAFISASLPLVLVTCAVGAQALAGRSRAFALLVAGVTACTIGGLLWTMAGASAWQQFEPWAVVLLTPAAVLLPISFAAARACTLSAAATAALAIIALLLPGGEHVVTGIEGLDRVLVQPRDRAALHSEASSIAAVHRAMIAPSRVLGLDHILFSGTQALYDLEGIGGADPLEVPYYRELVDTAGMNRTWYWLTTAGAADLPRLGPLLDLLGVRFLLTQAGAIPGGVEPLSGQDADRILAVMRPSAWPRAFFTPSAARYDTATTLLQQVARAAGPIASIQQSDRDAIDATHELTHELDPRLTSPAVEYALTPNTTTFRVNATAPGLAVLTETFLPFDFHATLNGDPVPYFRVNHAFKAVAIPGAGQWVVRFEYRPRYWWLTCGLAAMGLVLLATTVFIALSARRTFPTTATTSG